VVDVAAVGPTGSASYRAELANPLDLFVRPPLVVAASVSMTIARPPARLAWGGGRWQRSFSLTTGNNHLQTAPALDVEI